MIYEIANFFIQMSESLPFFRLVNYITFRAIMAALTAVIFIFLFSRHFILFVHRRCLLDQVRETGIDSAFDKRGTPTMGGVLIIGAVLCSMVIWGNWRNPFLLCSLGGMLWFGLIGFYDDIAKVRRKSGDSGMSERSKLILQGIFGLIFAWICVGPYSPLGPELSTKLYIPFYKHPIIDLGPYLYGLFIFLFLIFVSNAVNITDGLDGLAITPTIFVVGVLGIFAYVEGNKIYSAYLYYPYLREAGELTIFGAAFVGAGLGFLWYNAYPAQIFMGDTGSLAIGGTMAVISVLLKQEMLFPLLGGLFISEAFTSQIQDKIGVRWVGRRIFYRAPLHHDLQHRGIAETKVVIRLWIVAGILALISLATLKLR
ncbi:phospho-N-acetylmuramoyl-pentapeptide-transferase [Desulforhabdus amnigena]|jgi:phospho-N-acetylmuramoyl-pentapeptide-transferase|uniref:Phospho-N-acetylmuramoyl-pentapeptide-transferase n=1 Tax=Desulforhabdus amnigena TaxID=40218 RepID=A0A9W6FV62_9BACT|nr:phospho-N-acetylmuramoyl-pentapeptide-transferase [Desulforhabdus amnigena]NLJ29426.1 phospho-N-acetylmuramoyl-pentapeptide-transferase [Deltaproteobacteria bacterium]GLI35417.1 phospho-N-acetylmuramoyl-pentapeptide-transferase [Desulforhabdus amnigena]